MSYKKIEVGIFLEPNLIHSKSKNFGFFCSDRTGEVDAEPYDVNTR